MNGSSRFYVATVCRNFFSSDGTPPEEKPREQAYLYRPAHVHTFRVLNAGEMFDVVADR